MIEENAGCSSPSRRADDVCAALVAAGVGGIGRENDRSDDGGEAEYANSQRREEAKVVRSINFPSQFLS